MSAGPNSVAPVSRPDTVMMADIIRCSMNGRAITMQNGTQQPDSTASTRFLMLHLLSAASFLMFFV